MNDTEFAHYVRKNYGRHTLRSRPANDTYDDLRRDYEYLQDLAIMAIGLAGETGEVLEHVKKFIRDGASKPAEAKLEMGDKFVYTFALMQKMGMSFDDVTDAVAEKLDKRYAHVPQTGTEWVMGDAVNGSPGIPTL